MVFLHANTVDFIGLINITAASKCSTSPLKDKMVSKPIDRLPMRETKLCCTPYGRCEILLTNFIR